MFRKKWFHIDFWFTQGLRDGDFFLDGREQDSFEQLLRYLITKLRPKRKFYLWEDRPHCFLALEGVSIRKARRLIKRLHKNGRFSYYISKVEVNQKCGDDTQNGQGFLNICNAFTDYYLFFKDQKLSHIVHCCLEPIFQSRIREGEFYQKMAINYQSVKFIDGKVVYAYKDITPEVMAELVGYDKNLNDLITRR